MRYLFKIDKLIRDNAPQHLAGEGVTLFIRILSDDQYIEQLKLKLMEEAGEVIESQTREELSEELGDLIEVIFAFAQSNGHEAVLQNIFRDWVNGVGSLLANSANPICISDARDNLLNAIKVMISAQKSSGLHSGIAQVFSMIQDLVCMNNLNPAQIEAARHKKKAYKGGFEKKIYSAAIEIDSEKNDSFLYYLKRPKDYPEILCVADKDVVPYSLYQNGENLFI
jgi:predicted house-cleaning noncanonical NTP pyrophosphatase (MazG superfamily)